VPPMLEAVHLTKAYGERVVVDDLNLQVAPGEIFCLLGANGAGKTTTINLFLNFITPTKGEARINGYVVAEHPIETKQWLAYIPEQVMLYRNFTGLENLDYFSELAGKHYTKRELLDWLASVGLSAEAAERRVATYSKGMRQKVGIAIALAKEAKALLLDEPTSGLDPQAANEFSQLLTRLAAQGMAVLMATHDLFRAREVGTHIGIMRQGKLLTTLAGADLTPQALEQLYLDYMRN
jgi:ABC-2 type transport system ATP-binding protein